MILSHKDIMISGFISLLVFFIILIKHNKHILKLIETIFHKNKLHGSILYLFFTTLCTAFLIPITPFNALALYLYSPINGFLMSLLAHIVSGLFEFYIARFYAPQIIKERLEDNHILKSLIEKDFSQREWIELSTLLRLSPNFPYAFISYFLGFTKIPVSEFLIGSVLGCFPYLGMELYMLYNAGQVFIGKGRKSAIFMISATFIFSILLGKYVETIVSNYK